jgi:iron complex outermembrane receptor protein
VLTKNWSLQANAALSQNENVNWISDPLSSIVNNTPIAFSPALVAGSRLSYSYKGFEAALWNQYIGEQYLSNEGLSAHTLPAYHILNARGSYAFKTVGGERVQAFVELRNLAGTSYTANGYMWGSTPYYYAQATFNVMTGLTLEF